MSKLLHRYGSRIKSIYLELKNYNFYHGPSDLQNPDKRFIGRKEMIKKLKNLIIKSETNNGTYLVTGFRGMGKTSLVNKVLSDLFLENKIYFILKDVLLYTLIIWIATFFSYCFILAASLLTCFFSVYLVARDREKYVWPKKEKNSYLKVAWQEFCNIISNPFSRKHQENNFRKTYLYLTPISTLLLVASLLIVLWSSLVSLPEVEYHHKFYIFMGTLIFYLAVVVLVYKSKSHKKRRKEEKKGGSWLFILPSVLLISAAFWYIFPTGIYFSLLFILLFLGIVLYKDEIKRFLQASFPYNNIIPININLGKENLTEEDVLRLVSYGLYAKYRKIARPFGNFKRGVWTVGAGFLLYLIGSAFYFNKHIYQMVNELRYDSYLTVLFPSQSQFIEKIDDVKILEEMKKLDANEVLVDYYSAMYLFRDTSFISMNEEMNKRYEDHPFLLKLVKKNPKLDSVFRALNLSLLNKILPVSTALDYAFMELYNSFTEPFLGWNADANGADGKNPGNRLFSETLDIHANFRLVPRFDFIFLIYIFAFLGGAVRILRMEMLGMNHKKVLKKLKDLVENLEANVSVEEDRNLFFEQLSTKLNFFPRRRKEIPIKGAREIESGLIEILNDIETIPQYRMRPKFVFIFDELDKIQPRDIGEYENQEKKYSETEWVKKRQDTIGKILTNLKHFFNSAKAKYIFIAGREMYDAALADISDRDALIGSLFHEVIYVHSFYKDPADERLADITSMTERYISQFLIPGEYLIEKGEEASLKLYNQYLKEYDVLYDEAGGDEQEDSEELKNLRRVKVIIALHNFISYVSYRSNGAPKKITKIFEDYITSYPEGSDNKEKTFESTIITRNNSDERNLYLHFGYLDQYIFAMGKFLFSPFVIAVNKYIRAFEDKLLVSTAFLMNHIYKFHKVGFSHNTFELTPEIIAIYKAPELRDFIDRLVAFLKHNHIRRIVSGLYEFKFHSKIEKEIAFISKISESESAAFNFTLDESLIIKSIFRSKLKKIREYWTSDKEVRHQIDSIVFLNASLGDLSYNDTKYFEAIHYYKEALIGINIENFKDLTPDVIIFWIRLKLKTALTYEMIKSTDEALMIYDCVIRETEEYISHCYRKNGLDLFSLPRKHAPLLTITRLFYQPLVAQVQLIEKSTIKSLTKNKLEENIETFKRIANKYLEPEQNFLFRAEYYNKLGDLLYYKNGIPFGNPLKRKSDRFKHSFIDHFVDIQKKKPDREYWYALPVEGYEKYMISLASLLNVGVVELYNVKIRFFNGKKTKESEVLILHLFTLFLRNKAAQKSFPISRTSFLLAVGNGLSDAGDAILSIAAAEISNGVSGKNQDEIKEIYQNMLRLETLKTILKFESALIESDKQQEGDESLAIEKIFNVEELEIPNPKDHDAFRKKIFKFPEGIAVFKKLLKDDSKYFEESITFFDENNWTDISERYKKMEKGGKDNSMSDNDFKEFSNKLKGFLKEFEYKFSRDLEQFKTTKMDMLSLLKEEGSELFKERRSAVKKVVQGAKRLLSLFHDLKTTIINEKTEKYMDVLYSSYQKQLHNEQHECVMRLHIGLRYLYISAVYYLRAGEFKEYAFQLTKILQTIKTILAALKDKRSNNEGQQSADINYFFSKSEQNKSEKKPKEDLLNCLDELIMYKIIRYTLKAYKNYDEKEYKKITDSLFGEQDYAVKNTDSGDHNDQGNKVKQKNNGDAQNNLKNRIKSMVRTSTSAAEEFKEALLIYKEVELLLKWETFEIKDSFVTPYNNACLRSNRILELNYQSHFNYKMLKKMVCSAASDFRGLRLLKPPLDREVKTLALCSNHLRLSIKGKEIKSIISEGEAKEIVTKLFDGKCQELSFLILDSLFALYKMHQTIEIFGLSYIYNHSWYVAIYTRLGFWGRLYHAYSEKLRGNSKDAEEKFKRLLEKLIGKEERHDVNPISFYEKALSHAYKIYETHFEGAAYDDLIGEMNYLDDDFNDNLYHFSAAIERMNINFGVVERNIQDLSEVIKDPNERKRIAVRRYFKHIPENGKDHT